jgi:hypothetical protein
VPLSFLCYLGEFVGVSRCVSTRLLAYRAGALSYFVCRAPLLLPPPDLEASSLPPPSSSSLSPMSSLSRSSSSVQIVRIFFVLFTESPPTGGSLSCRLHSAPPTVSLMFGVTLSFSRHLMFPFLWLLSWIRIVLQGRDELSAQLFKYGLLIADIHYL